MFNFDYITQEDIKRHNSKWPEIPDHPYSISIAGDAGSGKTKIIKQILIKSIYMQKII